MRRTSGAEHLTGRWECEERVEEPRNVASSTPSGHLRRPSLRAPTSGDREGCVRARCGDLFPESLEILDFVMSDQVSNAKNTLNTRNMQVRAGFVLKVLLL